jgi:hypothetical protein
LVEFLKAFQALLEPLKTILKREHVDPSVLASFLNATSRVVIEEDQNAAILKMQVRNNNPLS